MCADRNTGNLFIVSAPSGAGKSTLLSRLVAEDPAVAYSVSHTTRAPRDGEKQGVDYYFVDEPEFKRLIEVDAFLEWARVHHNFYGTSAEPLLRELATGRDVILDIDVVGAATVRQKLPQAVSIFILPPNYQALSYRLHHRAKDSEEIISRRLQNAAAEISRVEEFDYVLINENLETCYTQLGQIINASRCRTEVSKKMIRKIIETFDNSR